MTIAPTPRDNRVKMRFLLAILLSLTFLSLQAQTTADNQPPAAAPTAPQDYVCPMDKDVRSDKPGKCPRCGMPMVLGIPDDIEYPLDLKITPAAFHAGQRIHFLFRITDPKTGKAVDHFEIVHDKLFHMFIASQDLDFFMLEHPVPQRDGTFEFDMTFPRPGMYR